MKIGKTNLPKVDRFDIMMLILERYRRGHNGADSKSVWRLFATWVRIPPAPPKKNGKIPILFVKMHFYIIKMHFYIIFKNIFQNALQKEKHML